MARWLRRISLLVLALALVAALAAWWLLRGSLPALDGEAPLPGLSSPVTIERDALGVVTIEAASATDAMRALGFVHAQERFFEMDLLRRTAAGELAELFGPAALGVDRRHRVHRMRARVEANLGSIAAERMPELLAYTEGVNAGLDALRVRPWPYLLLRQQPRPWRPADSALAGYAMYFDLQDATNARELALWKLRPHLPPALFALVTHPGSDWDAPLQGEPFGDAALPGPGEVDLRALPAPDDGAPAPLAPAAAPGSNNFAVSGELTADGRAIVADDMHLSLRVPNIWFRARLRYPDERAPGGRVEVQGFTLPGLPAVVVGSNGHVAWGFTNSYGDYLDWKLETPCGPDVPASTDASACSQVETHRERIAVAGGDEVEIEVRETAWGPVLHELPDGRLLALRWVAHLPGSLNFGLAGFATARHLDDALRIADRTAIPTQNLVIGDAGGRIAWRLLGPIPARGDCDGRQLVIEDGARCPPWGITTGNAPQRQSPTATRVWTANARVVSGAALARVGDGGYALGARQRQIRDRLLAKDRFDEQDLFAIQLDDRALLMGRWRDLLLEAAGEAGTPALEELAGVARDWSGHADTGSAAYRIVRAWRLAVHARLLDGLLAPARAASGDAFERPDLPQFEGVAWPLVTQRPAHLLPRAYGAWTALFEDAAREVRDELAAPGPLQARTWGERNTARICHPLSGALPRFIGRRLCMPMEPLPGDSMMPRVQGPAFGASQRMVVSPGHEADGIAHMPGGQSGHPLSPFWGAGHDDWAKGRPAPFLPGQARHRLRVLPATP
jgi:Protein related to penicillin acylase